MQRSERGNPPAQQVLPLAIPNHIPYNSLHAADDKGAATRPTSSQSTRKKLTQGKCVSWPPLRLALRREGLWGVRPVRRENNQGKRAIR